MRTVTYYHRPTEASERLKLLLEKELQKIDPEIQVIEFQSSNNSFIAGIDSLPAVKIGGWPALERVKYRDDRIFVDSIIHQVQCGREGACIIVPIDFSERAENSFANALKLAANTNAGIKLVHVMVDVPQTYNGVILDPDPAIEIKRRDHWRETVAFYRKKYRREIEGLHGNLTAEFLVGDPAKKVHELSTDPETRMVILGAKGAEPDSQHLFSSVNVEVATHARCPVLIIPETTKSLAIDKIILAIDESNMDYSMVEAIRALCGSPHAAVRGVRISQLKKGSVLKEEELVNVDQEKNTSEVIVFRPDLVASLMDYALERNADLLVAVRRKRGFIEGLFHHSTSEEIATNCVVPILIMHEWDPNINP